MNTKYYIIQLLIILFSTLMLQACCSTILTIGTAAFVTTTWNDSRTIGTQLDDNILKAHIAYALNKHQYIKKSTRIKNTVYQGNVLLTGQAPSVALTEDVVKIVMKIKGTQKIYNAIRQNKPISLQSIFKDFYISNQIYLNLFLTRGLQSSCIKIITENKEVFLLGKTTHEEGKYAEKIASTTHEVKNVFTLFHYI